VVKIASRSKVVEAQWVKEAYTVNERTMRFDHKRTCWVCGGKFKPGDGMTIAHTDRGNLTIHSRCLEER